MLGSVGKTERRGGPSYVYLFAGDELRWGIGIGVPLLDDQIAPQLEWVGATGRVLLG